MQLLSIEKSDIGKFLTTYKATYENAEGKIKEYELISRNKNLTLKSFGHDDEVTAVGIIAFNRDRSKILLAKEFRLVCNDWVYNFPGGLIDNDETVLMAAKRELKEETGLDMKDVIDILDPSYSAVGFSNERVYTIICTADGTFSKSTSADEEIEAGWFTKEDIKELFDQRAAMAQRTQSFLWMWCFGDILN